MDLSVYIKDLLYKHNCVIIPGFGAFVLNYAPTGLNQVSNIFTPPTKDIIFNPSINRNDGLLADYISEKINATYDESVRILRDSIEEMKATLNKGKKVYFKDIGNFTVNREGSYQFESDGKVNFYLDSFGLTALHSPIIIREGVARKIEKKIKEKDFDHKERHIIRTISWTAAASILLFAALTWTVMKTDVIKNVNQSYASILNTIVTRINNNDIKTNTVKQEIISNKPVTLTVYQPAKPIAQPTDNEPQITNNEQRTTYYVIGGCFSIEDNARKFMDDLREKGYKPMIIGKSKTGLIRVSYNSFNNMDKANNELSSIQSSQNPTAWLLKVKS